MVSVRRSASKTASASEMGNSTYSAIVRPFTLTAKLSALSRCGRLAVFASREQGAPCFKEEGRLINRAAVVRYRFPVPAGSEEVQELFLGGLLVEPARIAGLVALVVFEVDPRCQVGGVKRDGAPKPGAGLFPASEALELHGPLVQGPGVRGAQEPRSAVLFRGQSQPVSERVGRRPAGRSFVRFGSGLQRVRPQRLPVLFVDEGGLGIGGGPGRFPRPGNEGLD